MPKISFSNSNVPIIETDRLILRGHRKEDLAASVKMWADPIVVKHIGGKPFNEQQSWARILTYVGHWAVQGFGYWAVEEKSTGTFIGEMGFADFKRDMSPSIKDLPELGWALIPSVHGKGYATEALQAVLVWGGANLEAAKIVCIIDPENTPSIRVAEKIGFTQTQVTSYNGSSVILFSRSTPTP